MSDSDEPLAALAVAGDDDAMGSLLRKYGPQVRGRINGQIAEHFRSAFDEDDVMQVTYLEAFLRIDRFTSRGPGAFLAWLTRIAENNLRDAVKELKRAKRPPREKRVTPDSKDDSYVSLLQTMGGTVTTASRQAARHETAMIVKGCTAQLPPDYQKVVQLYDLEGHSAEKVGRIMGRSVGAVYMLRARALSQLQELLPTESKFFDVSA